MVCCDLSCSDSWSSMSNKMKDECGKSLLFQINNCVSRKIFCRIWELSHPIFWRAQNTAVDSNQHNFWVKYVTWRIKLQAVHLRHTRTRSDTGFEPGETLVTLGTMYVTQCPERTFLSATNTCSSKSENSCAINSSSDRLQLVGKTYRPALQKI